jgi:hypothetical protein
MQNNSGMLASGTVPATITSNQLSVSDIDNASSEIIYTITALPTNGVLLLNGAAMSVSDTFTQADLDNNLVVYQPAGTATSDQFGFTVADVAGGTMASDTFDIVIQVRQDVDDSVTDSFDTSDDDAEEDTNKDNGDSTETVELTEAVGEFGGGFVPFGSSSAPPSPAPVLSIDPPPVPVQEVEQPVPPSEPVEKEEEVVAEVDDYKAQTFTAVQMKSMDALWAAIDNMKQEMADAAAEKASAAEFRVAAAKSSGIVLTAGVVAWILRSGALLSSLMSTIPLWKGYDPLPILAYKDDEDEKEDEIDEDKIPTSLEDLRKLKKLKDKKAKEIDVDEIFGSSGIRE